MLARVHMYMGWQIVQCSVHVYTCSVHVYMCTLYVYLGWQQLVQ